MSKRRSTKDRLADALEELLFTHSLNSISVGDIVELADVSSRTFYNHFQDKNELMAYAYRRTVEPFWFTDGKLNSLEIFFTRCLENAQNRAVFQSFSNAMDFRGQNDLRSEIENKGVEDLVRLLQWNGYPGEITENLKDILHFFMCGISRECEINLTGSRAVETSKLWQFWMDCVPAALGEYLMMDPAEHYQ